MYNDKISINYLKQKGVKNSQFFSGDFSCCLHDLFKHIERLGYNCGVYGWNYDVFEIGDFYFVSGYRYPNINNHLDYFKLRKLNERFKKQQEKLSDKLYNKKIKRQDTYQRQLNKLIQKQKDYFIKKLEKLA